MAITFIGPIDGEVSTIQSAADNNYYPLTDWMPISEIGYYSAVVRIRWQTGDSIVSVAQQVAAYDRHTPNAWSKKSGDADASTPEACIGRNSPSAQNYYWIRFGVNVRNDTPDDGVWNRVGYSFIFAATE